MYGFGNLFGLKHQPIQSHSVGLLLLCSVGKSILLVFICVHLVKCTENAFEKSQLISTYCCCHIWDI